LLVMASHADWQRIESALKRLDVAPLQVLVEASIIEVTLTGDLQYGLQWFFKSSFDGKSGQGILDLDDAAGLSAIVPGFSYTLTDSANLVRGVLNLLAKRSQLNVISSPSVLVLDNHMAQIQVGDQQPVEAGTTTTDGGTTTKSIQYKDTGVLMSVTPRVNAGGLITMEIAQEVTDVGSIDSATGQRAFLKRNITSTIAVQSGEMVVLGGLIRDNTSEGKTGIPVLHDLPVVGNLFGGTNKASNRTELIVLLTPRIVRDPAEAREVGRQLRSRMQAIDGELFPIPMPMAEEPAPPAGG
ncbi:MAG: type II secretion system protein GspD, partial [Ectothiorhodospiraceae bacterium]|nr:type II secretion system protein GspD [Ectothiorhodospiraceae bacterium]